MYFLSSGVKGLTQSGFDQPGPGVGSGVCLQLPSHMLILFQVYSFTGGQSAGAKLRSYVQGSQSKLGKMLASGETQKARQLIMTVASETNVDSLKNPGPLAPGFDDRMEVSLAIVGVNIVLCYKPKGRGVDCTEDDALKRLCELINMSCEVRQGNSSLEEN